MGPMRRWRPHYIINDPGDNTNPPANGPAAAKAHARGGAPFCGNRASRANGTFRGTHVAGGKGQFLGQTCFRGKKHLDGKGRILGPAHPPGKPVLGAGGNFGGGAGRHGKPVFATNPTF